MNESENKTQTAEKVENGGKRNGRRGTEFLSIVGIILLCILLFGIPVLAVFLGQCWVIAWMVAHFFL